MDVHDDGTIERISERTDAATLYDEGMAHYRRREWQQARACFERVKALDPTRRGIEALLSELNIFLQLESVEESEAPQRREAEEQAFASEVEIVQPVAYAPSLGRSLRLMLIVVVVAIVVVGGVFLYSSDRLPFLNPEKAIENQRNRAQSLLLAQRWREAMEAYAELAKKLPEDPDVLNGLSKAKNGLYDEVVSELDLLPDMDDLKDMASRLEQLLDDLNALHQVDPEFEDVQSLLVTYDNQLQAIQMHVDAIEALASQKYDEAIRGLQGIRDLAPDYRPGTIGDLLYQAYLGRGARYLRLAAEALEPAANPQPEAPSYLVSDDMLSSVRKGGRDFAEAVRVRPGSNQDALLANELADALNEGLERYADWAWQESVAALDHVFSRDPGFFSGKVEPVLCDAVSHLIQFAMQQGDVPLAVDAREVMGRLDQCVSAQIDAMMAVLTPTATPTVTNTPTVTPTATSTVRPSATPTVMPTWTPTPPPPTEQPSSGGGGGGGGGSSPKPTRPSRK